MTIQMKGFGYATHYMTVLLTEEPMSETAEEEIKEGLLPSELVIIIDYCCN